MKMETFITREEAVETLADIIDNDLLNEDIQNKLEEIMICIEYEKHGYHAWGAGFDLSECFVAHRADMWTDELEQKVRGISKKYSFTPSPYEAEDFEPEGECEDE